MRHAKAAPLCILLAAFAVLGGAPAAAQRSPFDGTWSALIACSAESRTGAGEYSVQVPVTIQNGVMRGARGTQGQPGSLVLEGRVAANGAATMRVRGRVANPRLALGQIASGSPYAYTAQGRLSGNAGTARRQQGRPCTLTFSR